MEPSLNCPVENVSFFAAMSSFFHHKTINDLRNVCPVALSEDNCTSKRQMSQTLLYLFDLQAADEGEYQCVAESEAGTAERTITLKVQSEFCAYNYKHCTGHEIHLKNTHKPVPLTESGFPLLRMITLLLSSPPLSYTVNGGYSNWQEWSPCSSTCGQGFQERNRLCNNPEPVNGGRSCSGPRIDSRKCHAGLCPGANECFFVLLDFIYLYIF